MGTGIKCGLIRALMWGEERFPRLGKKGEWKKKENRHKRGQTSHLTSPLCEWGRGQFGPGGINKDPFSSWEINQEYIHKYLLASTK